jgi:hypothetical protein
VLDPFKRELRPLPMMLASLHWNKLSGAGPTPKPRCEVVLYWSLENQAFIAELPELRGRAADGRALPGLRPVPDPLCFLACLAPPFGCIRKR